MWSTPKKKTKWKWKRRLFFQKISGDFDMSHLSYLKIKNIILFQGFLLYILYSILYYISMLIFFSHLIRIQIIIRVCYCPIYNKKETFLFVWPFFFFYRPFISTINDSHQDFLCTFDCLPTDKVVRYKTEPDLHTFYLHRDWVNKKLQEKTVPVKTPNSGIIVLRNMSRNNQRHQTVKKEE
jgi:hypothetical protein